jgi:ribosomal protein S18 acetylase RimI-like enzyme
MGSQSQFSISRTLDRDKIVTCAQFMSTTPPWTRYGMDVDLCLKAFEGDFREVYVVESGDHVDGFAILQVQGTFKGYIQTLCVRAEMRGRGLGTLLLEFCEKRILEFSPNIFICVSDFNTGAARLYYSFGFKLVGELADFLRPGITELLLRKSYGPVLDYVPVVG